MVSGTILVTGAIVALIGRVSAHASIWTPSMYGFNETVGSNRPVDPLMNRTFENWWFHGHIDFPPNDGDIEQLPVGGTHTFEISCDKDATSYWTSGPGGDQQDPNNPDYPCPGQPTTEFHTNGIDDLGGCALGVAYKSDISQIQPEDITIFSVNQTCVWYLHTDFQIPAQMPKCPEGGCICAWFWIHRADSGSEQMYMTGFRCDMTGAVSTEPLPPAQVPRRCGPDPDGTPYNPNNCTWGAKQPLYWYQAEGNNMFEDTYHPPLYTDKYNFKDGAQNDIFNYSSTTNSTTQPSGSNTPPVPSGSMPVAGYSSSPAPLSSSSPSSSSPPPSASSSPPSSPSYPSDMQPSLSPPVPSPSSYPSDPQPSLSPPSSPPPSPSSCPDAQPSLPPPPSSWPPAGSISPSATPPTPNTPSTPSSYSDTPQPYQPSPSPTDQNDPAYTSKPKTKCKHGSKRSKQSSLDRRVESDHDARAHSPSHRRLSSLEDISARRVWGHRHRGVEKRDT